MNKHFFSGYSCSVHSSLSPEIKQDCQPHMLRSRFLESITCQRPGDMPLPVGLVTSSHPTVEIVRHRATSSSQVRSHVGLSVAGERSTSSHVHLQPGHPEAAR